MTRSIALLLAITVVPGGARQPQALRSPEVHPDRRVTFRFRAPNAKEVQLARDGEPRRTRRTDYF